VRSSENPNLFVVPEACVFAPGLTKAAITIESEATDPNIAFEELRSMTARNLALTYAATKGVRSPSINGIVSSAYGVTAAGVRIDEVKDEHGLIVPYGDPRTLPARWRSDVPVTAPIV